MANPRNSPSSRSPPPRFPRSTSWQVGDLGYWQYGKRWYPVKILSVDMTVLNLSGSAGERLTIEPQEGPKRGSTWLVPPSNVRRAEELPAAKRKKEHRARRSAKQQRESALLDELCRDHGYAMSMLSPRDTMGPISRRPVRCIKLIVPEDSALGRQIVQHARQSEREARRSARTAK